MEVGDPLISKEQEEKENLLEEVRIDFYFFQYSLL